MIHPFPKLAEKHMDPVWQVKWVNKGAERGEALVSISTDGRVVEWGMKKGLASTTLMVLKRRGNSEGVISRQVGEVPREEKRREEKRRKEIYRSLYIRQEKKRKERKCIFDAL
jgi:hypothetical protein